MPFLRIFSPLHMLLLLFIFSSSSTNSFHDDQQSLLAFKKGIVTDPHGSMADWSPTTPFCNWTAVTCSRRHMDRVVSLDLSDMKLYGTISPSLANLSFLHTLDLSGNALHGHIPRQLGRLFRLRNLWLDNNRLNGGIPSGLGNCTNLVSLVVLDNHLTGNIPRELGSLTQLQQVHLGSNSLTGNISPFWSNISTLLDLNISTNKLTGNIPQELGLLTHLQTLSLHTNELSGNIPTSLSNISTFTILEIFLNKLTGNIPTLSNLFNLSALRLWGNQLSGNIPNSIGNCSKLIEVKLNDNKLSGNVPMELGKLFLLKKLFLQNNQLGSGSTTTMSLLIALTNCSCLNMLSLGDNKLTSVLPLAIGKLSTNLSYLSLANNMIEGNIPPHIGNLSSLTCLNLSRNLLNGNIPSLRNLKNLERLYLGNNKLEGNIPNDFEHLQRLGLLDISRNMLSGKIPISLAPLKQLRDLLLHHNQLSGSIPSELGNCTNLELLDLSHNILTGSIPREIVQLYNLHFYLNLSWNSLEGSLPMEIGKIAMAQAIDISSNHLTGVIPYTLGSCVELSSLNLSRNSFHGFIPGSLENLRSLMSLDLSSNSLSGTIPVTLNKLKMLQCLNLSFNKLTGEMRREYFANQSISIYLNGNPNLCGPKLFLLSTCPTTRGLPTIVKRVLLSLIGVVFFILCLFLIFLWRRNQNIDYSRNTLLDYSRNTLLNVGHQGISYQEIHIATDGFAETNLLGAGNSRLVYKGTLADGRPVAVKVFQLQNDQDKKSFEVECNILKKARHKNLVRVITSCNDIHFKCLVFGFMSNGSLDKHLYHNRDDNNGEDVSELGLITQLYIAIDVAHAIEYLHHDCFVEIVHCDIKPSNVLLDEDMRGHVTDFGIARIICGYTNSHTSSLALRGSIGYIAPEYGLGGTISTQGDVYSYGIMLLEMLTKKKPTNDMFVGDLNLHDWVNSAFPNKVKEVIDSSLFTEVDGDEFEESSVYKCLHSLLFVGLFCSKHSPEERPTMKVVVRMLESIREDLMANTFMS